MKKALYILLFILRNTGGFSQDAPNDANAVQMSPTTASAARLGSSPISLFTGIPGISIPLYKYANPNGLSLDISADFFAGGIKDGEQPSTIGLGWCLNAGGVITRTVRGLPDDKYETGWASGFIYADTIPVDFRSNGDTYYNDQLDAQQDVFEYNVNGLSGTFYIGKNKQVALEQTSKLKILFNADPNFGTITSFTIITEDGIKYVFNQIEYTRQTITQGNSFYNSGLTGTSYVSAWYLSYMIAPFNTDTVKFNYTSTPVTTSFSYPQVAFVKTGSPVPITPVVSYSATGTNTSTINKISSIVFPDKRQVSFIYDSGYIMQAQFNNFNDAMLVKMNISDSIFRYGYIFNYQTYWSGTVVSDYEDRVDTLQKAYSTLLLLDSITPYTSKEASRPYKFIYNTPYPNITPGSGPLESITNGLDSVNNGYDYWGYFNGFNNHSISIPGLGALRMPTNAAIENSLAYMYLPTGGYIHYEYENNQHQSYTKEDQSVTVTASGTSASSENTVTFSDIYSNLRQLVFTLDNSVSRVGSPPLSGTCNLVCNIKSTDGSVLYADTTISLSNLFYLGLQTWTFSLPANGTYQIQTSLSGGGSVTTGMPVIISWENKVAGYPLAACGGIRIKRITKSNPSDSTNKESIIEDYQYLTSSGASSGFLGDTSVYSYPYTQIVLSPASTTSMSVLSSDPISDLNFSQGAPVGYSRVTVFKGTSTHNLGYTVYEFTGLQDVGSNYVTSIFPFAPQDIKQWGLGLPKRITVYDSSGHLVKSTVNQYSFKDTSYNSSSFTSLKLGKNMATYAEALYPTEVPVNSYIGQQYHPSGGWAELTGTTDTLFNKDGSIQTDAQTFVYDTNYNVVQATGNYDRTRGLQLQTNLYYPYNYTVSGTTGVGRLRDSGIISPVIATEKWIIGDGNTRMVSGSITDYQVLSSSYVKPVTTYSLQSNAPVPLSTIGAFNGSQINRNSTYFVAQNNFPLYDSKGHLLQATNAISGVNSTVIMDYNKEYPVAKISNAAINDVAYTSFESDGSGNWSMSGGTQGNSIGGLTGNFAYNLSQGNITKSGLTSTTNYIVSLWAKNGSSVNINGSTLSGAIAQQNGWNLYTTTLTGVTSATISGSAGSPITSLVEDTRDPTISTYAAQDSIVFVADAGGNFESGINDAFVAEIDPSATTGTSGTIDELRLYPKDANMVTYTYEPLIGVTSMCDANNTVSYSTYDNLNRPKLILDKDKNILKRFDYSDTTIMINTSPQWVVTGRSCETNNPPAYDSTYQDMNPYSDSFLVIRSVFKGYDCSFACGHPTNESQYKIINGACEKGVLINIATKWMKINDDWMWQCTSAYQFSDGSISSEDSYIYTYTTEAEGPCPISDYGYY
jgi:hypothetical protein